MRYDKSLSFSTLKEQDSLPGSPKTSHNDSILGIHDLESDRRLSVSYSPDPTRSDTTEKHSDGTDQIKMVNCKNLHRLRKLELTILDVTFLHNVYP
jgi:hypothetical protein